MPQPLRVGIAGAGWVAADRHVPVLLSTEGVRIVAIYDRYRDRAARLGERIPKGEAEVPCFDDLGSFLAEDLDIVHVTSSPQSHHDISIAALGSGAHVFTEKPMAMTPYEAEAMALEARRRSRLLCVSHNFLSSSSMQAARRRIGNERIDYVSGFQLSSYRRRLPKWYGDLPGGLMFDEIPHMVYSIGALLEGPLALDHARATFDEAHHPETVEVLLRGPSGNGQITMVFCSPVSEWHIMTSSRAGIVGVDLFRDIMTHVRPDGAHGSADIARSSMSAIGGHVSGFARAGARWALKRQFWGHDRLIHEFIDAVRTGKDSPVSLDDALGVVGFTQQLLESLGLDIVSKDHA